MPSFETVKKHWNAVLQQSRGGRVKGAKSPLRVQSSSFSNEMSLKNWTGSGAKRLFRHADKQSTSRCSVFETVKKRWNAGLRHSRGGRAKGQNAFFDTLKKRAPLGALFSFPFALWQDCTPFSECAPHPLPAQPARKRRPHGTQGGLLSAAWFPT